MLHHQTGGFKKNAVNASSDYSNRMGRRTAKRSKGSDTLGEVSRMTSRHFLDVDLIEDEDKTSKKYFRKAASKVMMTLSFGNHSTNVADGSTVSNKVLPLVSGGTTVGMTGDISVEGKPSLIRRLSGTTLFSKRGGIVSPAPIPTSDSGQAVVVSPALQLEHFQHASCIKQVDPRNEPPQQTPSKGILSRKGSSCSSIPTHMNNQQGEFRGSNHDSESESWCDSKGPDSPRGNSCSNIPVDRNDHQVSATSSADIAPDVSTPVKRKVVRREKHSLSADPSSTATASESVTAEGRKVALQPISVNRKIVLPQMSLSPSIVTREHLLESEATNAHRRRVVRRGSSLKKQASTIFHSDGTMTVRAPTVTANNEEKTEDNVSLLRSRVPATDSTSTSLHVTKGNDTTVQQTDDNAEEQEEGEFLRTRRRSTLVMEGDLSTCMSRLWQLL